MQSSLRLSPFKQRLWFWLELLPKPGNSAPPPSSSTTSASTGGGWRSDSYSLLLTELAKGAWPQKTPFLSPTAEAPSSSPRKAPDMNLTSADKQQIETAVDTFLESPSVQSTVTSFIGSAEKQGVALADTIINNAKAGGLLGGIVNALKGSAETELNTLVASLPAAAISMLATKAIEGELKTILGA